MITQRHHWIRVALALTLSLIIAGTPLLRGVARAQKLAGRQAPQSLSQALGLDDAPPQINSPQAPSLAAQRALDSDRCGSGDAGSDADLDGTNDFVEYCLGLDPYYYDSDRDAITDTLELEGFTYAGPDLAGELIGAISRLRRAAG